VLKILSALVFILCVNAYPQSNDFRSIFRGFSLNVSMNYVSSGTILLNPSSADLLERNTTREFKGGYGYGATLKKRISEDIYIGISTEYLKIQDDQLVAVLENDVDYIRARLTESVQMMPIEVSAYFNIPRFVNNLDVYVGGGAGFYFGNRTEKMLGMETKTISKDPLFSLNVLFGAEYFIEKNASFNIEMKVRDGKFRVHNQYPTNKFTYDGQTYYFDQDLYSKVYVDGLKMSVGFSYYF
jgi:hypothetical protein